ncbi:MAG: prenyltransferase, partial [Kiritimatiellia bacterium]
YFGDAGGDSGGGSHCGMYAHSIATLFLSEVSGMVDSRIQKRIDKVLPDATRILLRAQSIKKKNDRDIGGWRYRPNSPDSDLSCSGWCLMALRSAKLNGAQVPPRAIAAAVSFIQRHANMEQGGFYYQNKPNEFLSTLTGAGILCLELCGKHNDPASLRGARYLAKNYKQLARQGGNVFYGVYYTSQGLFQLGGEPWKNFAEWMYATWIPKQLSDGSWNHGEGNSSFYQTSMIILAFTVPYRQLPIYQRDETVDE